MENQKAILSVLERNNGQASLESVIRHANVKDIVMRLTNLSSKTKLRRFLLGGASVFVFPYLKETDCWKPSVPNSLF